MGFKKIILIYLNILYDFMGLTFEFCTIYAYG